MTRLGKSISGSFGLCFLCGTLVEVVDEERLVEEEEEEEGKESCESTRRGTF